MEIKIPFLFDEKDCHEKVDIAFQKILLECDENLDSLNAFYQQYLKKYEMESLGRLNSLKEELTLYDKNSELLVNDTLTGLDKFLNSMVNISEQWKTTSNSLSRYGLKMDFLMLASKNIKAMKENMFLLLH